MALVADTTGNTTEPPTPGSGNDNSPVEPPSGSGRNDHLRTWDTAEKIIGSVVATAALAGLVSFLGGSLALFISAARTGSKGPEWSQLMSSMGFFGVASQGAAILVISALVIVPSYLIYEWGRLLFSQGAQPDIKRMLADLSEIQEKARGQETEMSSFLADIGPVSPEESFVRGCANCERSSEMVERFSPEEKARWDDGLKAMERLSELRQKAEDLRSRATGHLTTALRVRTEMSAFYERQKRRFRRSGLVFGVGEWVAAMCVFLLTVSFRMPQWLWLIVGLALILTATSTISFCLLDLDRLAGPRRRTLPYFLTAFAVLILGGAVLLQADLTPSTVTIRFDDGSRTEVSLLYRLPDGLWIRTDDSPNAKFVPMGRVLVMEYAPEHKPPPLLRIH